MMYPSGRLEPEEVEDVMLPDVFHSYPPPPSSPVSPLSPTAFKFAQENPAKASKLLEWAAAVHEPRRLVIQLEKVKFTLQYVKLERNDVSLVFYLDAGAPGIGFAFGVELLIEFEGATRKVAATCAQEQESGKAFPYTRLEFFNLN